MPAIAFDRFYRYAELTTLVHALAAACADGAKEITPPTEALKESSFRAARDGVHASIWWRGALRPIREVGADALALARPYAREFDGEDALEEIERILREGGGADRMRAAYTAGGMEAVLTQLVSESYGSTQTTSSLRTFGSLGVSRKGLVRRASGRSRAASCSISSSVNPVPTLPT